jgi:hypothetical protein
MKIEEAILTLSEVAFDAWHWPPYYQKPGIKKAKTGMVSAFLA